MPLLGKVRRCFKRTDKRVAATDRVKLRYVCGSQAFVCARMRVRDARNVFVVRAECGAPSIQGHYANDAHAPHANAFAPRFVALSVFSVPSVTRNMSTYHKSGRLMNGAKSVCLCARARVCCKIACAPH